MAYTALYRKFRPDTFKGVVGQDHIVRTLKNQMISGRVSHAYLFCGTRGTGKTSTAKIFAKAINCLNPQDGEPCGKCELCTSMAEGRSVNVIEIDAASNNGVDNIREIREEVKYPPTEGRFKVYIIDEVHMLSTGAFNALLKTLEEPPEHVIFILATTDPQKVPATIHSRCQRFDFKRISAGEIVSTLRGYIEKDGGNVTDKALHYIANLADGSMRDSLSILDQCMAFYYGEEITLEKVLDIAGAVDTSVFFEMTEALNNKNAAKCMDIIDDMINDGRDVGQFVNELTAHLRNLLITLTVKEADAILDMAEENIDRLTAQSKAMSAEELIFLIKTFSRLSGEMKYANNQRILLEVEVIKLCSPSEKTDFDAVIARLAGLERQVKNGVVVQNVATSPQAEVKKAPPKKQRPKALPEDVTAAIDIWSDLISEFDPILQGLMSATKPGYMEDGRLTIVCDNLAVEGLLKDKISSIKEAFDTRLKKEFDIRTIVKAEFESWERVTYGDNQEESDPEFESLMGGYFPEADFE